MNAAIVCVGKLREKFYAGAADEYLKRLSRYGKMEIVELPDLPEPQNASDADRQKIMDREGESILKAIRTGDHVTAMCINAPQFTSEQFAEKLRQGDMRGGRQVFVIGGSLGLAPQVVARAQMKLSFSPMTFPHQLARIMLLEQTYRALKIAAGERYHK